ncbi:MAG TPA: acyl carrier protein [Pseudonocardiaceae bacterium]
MYEQLREMLITAFKVPAAEFSAEATLNDLGLDSLDLVELAMAIEQGMGAKVSDDDLAEAGRVDAVVALIESRSAKVS